MATQDVEIVPSSPFQTILNFRDVGRTANLLQTKVSVLPSRLVAYNQLAACSFNTVSYEKGSFSGVHGHVLKVSFALW